ncbi:MAG: hypothetical protein PHW46_04785 [Candidatus Omnitrophica bacterium]|nr:hypothetical protein [Candidatus Omnitrophota bacterium]
MQTAKVILPDELKSKFRSLVNARCGLYFKDYDLKDLENAIALRMKSNRMDSPLAYYDTLTASEKKEDEIRELLNLLTIKHTYFFRNEPQFKVLKDTILPEVFGRLKAASTAAKPTIRIWSAGCSTGEEPYSIAMVIKDIVPDLEAWDIRIFATDASTEALEGAHRGVYNENSMRLVDNEHRKKYFQKYHQTDRVAEYAINDEIKKMVDFSYLNLVEEEYPGNFDVIFCRNVVIYFELETTIRVMEKFAKSLNDDGYFFIGYSESLQFISDKFKMVDRGGAIVYMRSNGEPELPRISPLAIKKTDSVIEEILKAEVGAEIRQNRAKKKNADIFQALLVKARKAAYLKQYDQAMSLVEEARSMDEDAVDTYCLAAEICANRGWGEKAKASLNAALEKDTLFAPAHYLLGFLYNEEGDIAKAQESFKKAIYLDKDFSLAHFALANIYRDGGRTTDAIREYRNTLDILYGKKIYDIIAYSGGFNAASIAGICKSNIERLKAV